LDLEFLNKTKENKLTNQQSSDRIIRIENLSKDSSMQDSSDSPEKVKNDNWSDFSYKPIEFDANPDQHNKTQGFMFSPQQIQKANGNYSLNNLKK